MNLFHKIAVAAILCSLAAGDVWGAKGDGETEAAIRTSVRLYADGVIIASKKDNVEHMEPYTTEKRAQKLFIWFKSWHENNYFMDSAIERFAVESVKHDAKKATVTTKERWHYRYIHIVTKEVTQPWTQIDYRMRYDLLKVGSHWKVDEAKVLSEKETPLQKTAR